MQTNEQLILTKENFDRAFNLEGALSLPNVSCVLIEGRLHVNLTALGSSATFRLDPSGVCEFEAIGLYAAVYERTSPHFAPGWPTPDALCCSFIFEWEFRGGDSLNDNLAALQIAALIGAGYAGNLDPCPLKSLLYRLEESSLTGIVLREHPPLKPFDPSAFKEE